MKNIKGLVVDDDKTVRDFLVQLLSLRGVDAQAVDDGNKAIAAIKQEKYDIVFLDMMMPGINGLETLRELKKISPDTAYIMITGYPVDDILKEAESIGALASLKKPFDISYIFSLVNNYHRKEPQRVLDILVVDDDKSVREFFGILFKYKNYNLTLAETGKAALDLIDQKNFDIVFIDAILRDMDGIKLCGQIRRLKPRISVVSMSGDVDKAQAIDPAEQVAFIPKPFQIEKIFLEIDKVRQSREGDQ